MRPFVEFLLPRGLLGVDLLAACRAVGVADEGLALEPLGERDGSGLRVTADSDGDLLDQTEHLVVGVDLDDLGILGPVVHAVLRERSEGAEASTEGEHHVRLADQLHRGLGSLVAERSGPQRVAGGERVVVQVAVDDGGAETLGECLALLDTVGHHHAAAGHDDRELGLRQQFRRLVQARLATGAAVEAGGLRDLRLDLTVEVVARNVELRRAHLGHRAIEAAAGELGHALRVVDVPLVLRELLEHRQLVGFLEAAQARSHGAGLGSDDDDGAVRPERGGNRGDAVADTRTVLPDHHAVPPTDPGIPVGHVSRALLVHDRDEPNPGGSEDVHRIHEGGSHDAEHVGDAVGDHRLDERLRRCHLLYTGDSGAIGTVLLLAHV